MKNKLKNFAGSWGWRAGWLASLMVGGLTYAGTVTNQQSTISNPIAADTFPALLALVLQIIITVGLPIVILSVIFVGFKYVTAQGNAGKLKEAHAAFKWVMVGAAIVLGSQVIVSIIQNTVDKVKTG